MRSIARLRRTRDFPKNHLRGRAGTGHRAQLSLLELVRLHLQEAHLGMRPSGPPALLTHRRRTDYALARCIRADDATLLAG
eukprot:5600690-Pyramimonas_sp.AAC.2